MKRTVEQNREQLIKKSNLLIQKSRYTMTLQQQKIILYMIAQISPYDADFKQYTFNINEFCKVTGIDTNNGTNYKELKSNIKTISDKSAWITLPDGRETLVRWIEKPYIDKGKGTITLKLDKDLRPYLLQLRENYTQYEMIWTLQFKSKYSIRLYEYIKSIHYNELEEYEKIVNIEELRNIMGVEKETLTVYRDFKRRALKPAEQEINEKSDKEIKLEEIKDGKKVVAIKIKIQTKETTDRLQRYIEINDILGNKEDQTSIW